MNDIQRERHVTGPSEAQLSKTLMISMTVGCLSLLVLALTVFFMIMDAKP